MLRPSPGVIRLPGREDLAIDLARAEAQKNGYTNGAGGVIVDVRQGRREQPSAAGQDQRTGQHVLRASPRVQQHSSETRDSKAEYVLPVPMGSPENYYGVFGLVRHCATTTAARPRCQTANGYTTFDDVHTPTVRTTDTGWLNASATKGTVNPNWTTTGQRLCRGQQRGRPRPPTMRPRTGATSAATITFRRPSARIDGIELSAEVSVDSVTSGTNCAFQRGALLGQRRPRSRPAQAPGSRRTPALTATDVVRPLPTRQRQHRQVEPRVVDGIEMNNTNFRVRITALKASSTACADARILRDRPPADQGLLPLDRGRRHESAVFHPDTNVAGPASEVLTPRGFWGMMLIAGRESRSAATPTFPATTRTAHLGPPSTTRTTTRRSTTTTPSRWPRDPRAARSGSTTRASAPVH